MKTIKIRQALLLTLTLFSALQPLTATCKEEDTSGSWWSNTIFSTISKCYNTAITQIKKHPYMTASAAVFLTVAVTGLAALYQKKQNKAIKLLEQQEQENNNKKNEKIEKNEKKNEKIENPEEKINEQIEKNEKNEKEENTTPKFKYTASMALLMTTLPGNRYRECGINGKIMFTPKPKVTMDQSSPTGENIWLWNDGCASNGTYTVTYKGKKYVSTDNLRCNHWKALKEERMDFFTYYDYLVENKQNLDPFIDYLIGQTLKMLSINDSITNPENSKNSLVKESLKNALAQEAAFANKDVFYSGYSSALDTFYTFVTLLHNYLDINSDHRERSSYESLTKYDNVDDFITQQLKSSNDVEQSAFLMSAHMGLFGGILDHDGECTVCYFKNNFTYAVKEKKKIITPMQKLCDNIGLKFPEKITDLYEEYSKLGGKLKQIFINTAHTNKIAYIASAYGYSLKNPDSISQSSYGEEFQVFAKNLENIFFKENSTLKRSSNNPMDVTNFLAFLRMDPKNKPFRTACKETRNKYGQKYGYSSVMDKFQIRLLHFFEAFTNPEKAKEYGLEIFYYFAQKDACEKQKELDKQMDALVKEMLWKALESGTLTGGAENSNLAKLYKMGKITKIEDLQIENLKKLVNKDLI